MTRFILSSRAWQRLLCLSLFVPQFFVPQYLAQAQGLPIDTGHNSQCGVTMSCGGGTGTGTGTGVPGGGGMCAVNPNGNTCGSATGTASVSGQGGLNVGAGNPINLISGNKYQQEVDLPALPGTLGIEIVRHYNSQSRERGQLGASWKLSYETDLYADAATVQIIQADGRRLIFSRDARHPSLCQSSHATDGRIDIRKNAAGHEEFVWTWNNGRKLSFNEQGKLDAIVTQDGQTLTLQRGPKGELLKVTDPQHRSLVMHYGTNKDGWRGIVAIDTPVGRFAFAQTAQGPGAGNLAQVIYPDGKTVRRYHYTDTEKQTEREDGKDIAYLHPNPHLLTGITVQGQGSDGKPMNQRITTWAYDHGGRAVLSTHADGVEKVTLDYSRGGGTVLTNSLHQTTVYRHAIVDGEYRLLEAIGPGCASCGQTNVRYRWSDAGQLLMETTLAPGDGTKPLMSVGYEYDKLGRLMKQSRRTYDAKARATPWQWQVRYEYEGNGSRPNLIARPSVVAGKEYVTRIAYNDKGQPVAITETGFTPSMDGKAAVESIARALRYRYDSQGMRVETDGPMPNARKHPGPDNSDIALAEYDARTRLPIRLVAPGNVVTEVLERDEALRPVKVTSTDGSAKQIASIRYNWRGQPEEISLFAERSNKDGSKDTDKLARILRYSYDLDGRITSITQPGNLTTRFEYDGAGRITRRILPDGSKVAVERDTEDRLLGIGAYRDASAKPSSRTAYGYDELNRVDHVEDQIGTRFSYRYTDLGQIAVATNALGAETHFSYDDSGLLALRVSAAGTPDAATMKLSHDGHGQATVVIDSNGVTTKRIFDDFGRKVAEINPDRGVALYRYDAASRMAARIDETGVTTRYSWDHANRLVSLGADKNLSLVQYRYDGMHLTEVIGTPDGKPEHAAERATYETNAFGQIVKEVRWMLKVDGKHLDNAALTFVTRSTYDDAGRLVEQVLPDGHRMVYRYAPVATDGGKQGQLTAILFDDKEVVHDIEQTLAGGLTGYVNGNGVKQTIRLDSRGRVEELRAMAVGSDNSEDLWSRIKAWIAGDKAVSGNLVYAQVNRFDAVDRMTDIERVRLDRESAHAETQREHYRYDNLDRLTDTESGGATRHLRYDRGGNRVAEEFGIVQGTAIPDASSTNESAQPPGSGRLYQYAPGTNRLVGITRSGEHVQTIAAPRSKEEAAQWIRTAWLYHATGVPLARFDMPSANSRRIVYNAARRPVEVFDAQNRMIARYRYNLTGERIAKTVFDSGVALQRTALNSGTQREASAGITTYSLYRDHRLAAEADEEGRVTAHYVYLNGMPVAKIETAPDVSGWHRILKAVWTLGGLIEQNEADADDSVASIYAIHTDHRGVPQVVTDAEKRIV
jgi:YD repeat-containing protein